MHELFTRFGLVVLCLLSALGCGSAPEGGSVNPIEYLKKGAARLLSHESPPRWALLGADGRVLDVRADNLSHVGQSAVLKAPPQGGSPQSQTTSLLIARSSVPRNPEVITITLGIDVADQAVGVDASTLFLPQAQITWGSGSADASSNVAIVDIVKGTQVTVLGSVISVDGIYNAPLGVGALHPDARFSASLAYGPRGSGAHMPTFTDLGSVANGSNTTFIVPNFARDVTIYAVDLTTGAPNDLNVRYMRDDAGTTITAAFAQNQAAAPNTVPPRAYPLPGWVRAINLANPGAHTALVSLVYGLAL